MQLSLTKIKYLIVLLFLFSCNKEECEIISKDNQDEYTTITALEYYNQGKLIKEDTIKGFHGIKCSDSAFTKYVFKHGVYDSIRTYIIVE